MIDKKQVAGILTAQWNELPFERKQVQQYYDLIIFPITSIKESFLLPEYFQMITLFLISGILQATRRSKTRVFDSNEKI